MRQLQAGFTLRQAIDIKGYTLGNALLQTNQFGQSSGKIDPLDRALAVKVFQYPRHPENNGFLQQDCNTALRKIFDRLSLIHISEPTRLGMISYAVFCLKKK